MSSAKLTYSVNRAIDPNTDKFVVKQATAEATAEQAFEWYTGTLPQHFQAGARIKYGSAYTGRTIEYSRKKKRVKGHDIDMVWSGEMRDEYLRGKPLAESKQNKNNVVTKLKFPYVRKANFWKGGTTSNASGVSFRRHNFDRELTAFNPADSKRFQDGVEKRLPAIVQRILNDPANMETETFEAN